jgi:hypothetical protein
MGTGDAPNAPWYPDPDVVLEKMEGSSVVINLSTNRMFELNETATRFWELLMEGDDIATIKERLVREYDVDRSTVDREVEDLMFRLAAERLIHQERP